MSWIGGALSLGGALLQSDSAEDAASAQEQSTAAAVNEQRRQYDLNRSDLAPYRDTGRAAVTRISDLLGLGTRPSQRRPFLPSSGRTFDALLADYNKQHVKDLGMTLEDSVAQGLTTPENYGLILDRLREQEVEANNPQTAEAQDADFGSLSKKFTLADFWDDPVTKASYEFGLNEGTKALDRIGGARGNRNSGAQLKALTRFGTDYTGQKAGESYNRFYGDQDRTFNRLSGVAGTGQTATNTGVAAGSNSANTIGGLLTAQGNARGAAAIAGGNAINGAANNFGNWWNQQQTLSRLTSRPTAYGSGGGPNPYYGSDYVDS